MSSDFISTFSSGRRSLKAWLLAVTLFLFLIEAINFLTFNMSISDVDGPLQSSSPDFHFPPLPLIPRNESFGACLLVKGDNDLLSEWLPYHYTILPLRYLVVMTDAGNPEDPKLVLEKWTTADTGLHWWVFDMSEFENIHGDFDSERESSSILKKLQKKGKVLLNDTIHHPIVIQEVAHEKLVHKQKAMITLCSKFMKERGVRWTSMYDTDEFLVINRMGTDEQSDGRNTTEYNESPDNKYGMRQSLPPIGSNDTVVDIIYSFEKSKQPLSSCHLLPRVSFGTSENITCPGSEDVKAFAREYFDQNGLSTLRYQSHAVKEDFSKNRFGKVFIDVSNFSDHTLSKPPRNIHRPFPNECKRPIGVFEQSLFYLMHYAGGWERFQAKNDTRRDYEKWKELSDVSDSTSCCQQEAYRWLPRFVDQVGLRRAKFLLGQSTSMDRIEIL